MCSRITVLIFLCLGAAYLTGSSTLSQEIPPADDNLKICIVGDILMSRLIEREFQSGKPPLIDPAILKLFAKSRIVSGNLEGAVGETSLCRQNIPPGLCFAIHPDRIGWLHDMKFTALSVENNHSFDLGLEGLKKTQETLMKNSIRSISFDSSPVFFKINHLTVAVIACSNIRSNSDHPNPYSPSAIKIKLEFAHQVADLVIVMPHWGNELHDWVSPELSELANLYVSSGADVIAGSHPHVVIPFKEIQGKPVFCSLGNFIFDQKYEETRIGSILQIAISEKNRTFSCRTIPVALSVSSNSPYLVSILDPENLNTASVSTRSYPLNNPLQIEGITLRASGVQEGPTLKVSLEGWIENRRLWTALASDIVSVSKGRCSGGEDQEMLLSVERHYSDIDGEIAPRPYVYRITPSGPIALWRGSALALPLVDARFMREDDCRICALHRGDSFLMLNPAVSERKRLVYRWNGFGFSGFESPEASEECEKIFPY